MRQRFLLGFIILITILGLGFIGLSIWFTAFLMLTGPWMILGLFGVVALVFVYFLIVEHL